MALKDALHTDNVYRPGKPVEKQEHKYDNPILNEREKTHGDFGLNADCQQDMFSAWRERYFKANGGAQAIPAGVALAMSEVFHKLARMAANPMEDDHYEDAKGYLDLAKKYR